MHDCLLTNENQQTNIKFDAETKTENPMHQQICNMKSKYPLKLNYVKHLLHKYVKSNIADIQEISKY